MGLFFVNKYVSSRLDEIVLRLRRNRFVNYFYSFVFMDALGSAIILIVYLAPYIMRGNFDISYIIISLRGVMVAFFLPGIVAILLGFILGKIKNMKLLFCMVIVVLYLFSPSFYKSAIDNVDILEVLRKTFLIFQISSKYYMHFVEGYFVAMDYLYIWAQCFILISGLGLIFYRLYYRKIKKYVCLFLCCFTAISLVYYYKPHGKTYDFEWGLDDIMEYRNYPVISEEYELDFKVEAYDITFDFNDELIADCTIRFDRDDLDEYQFTLYKALKITQLTDLNGNKLRYTREGDYLYIDNPHKLEGIHIEYNGVNDYIVANREFVYLMEFRPYYPIAGIKGFNMPSGIEGTTRVEALVCNDFESEYKVKIKNDNGIYTNLSKNDDGSYAGKVKGISFFRGYFDEITVEDVKFVYSRYEDGIYEKDRNEAAFKYYYEQLYQFAKEYSYNLSGKTVFVLEEFLQAKLSYYFSDSFVWLGARNITSRMKYENIKRLYELEELPKNYFVYVDEERE